jgi:uncharacterized membrane protein
MSSAPAQIAVRELSAAERSSHWRVRLRLRETTARSLVLVPALYLVGAVALGIALPAIDHGTNASGLLGIDVSAARSVLEAIASGMIAFAGLVVSVAVLVVQFGAGQYSPRLVQIFRRDPVIKNAIGLIVVPGVFALVAAADIGGVSREAPLTLTVVTGLALMLLALIALFRFIGRLLDLMRPRRIYARLVREAYRSIRVAYPFLLDEEIETRSAPTGAGAAVVAHEHRDGVLAAVDRSRVMRAAAASEAIVEVGAQIGAYVPHHAPLFIVHGGREIDARALHHAVVFADGRRITQDPSFAIRCVVDVAIRALSPAVNDPTSAVEGLDALNAILGRVGRLRLGASGIVDGSGALRLVLPTPGWDRLIDLALPRSAVTAPILRRSRGGCTRC